MNIFLAFLAITKLKMDHTTDTDENFTEEPKDQHPSIRPTGNKYFILSPGKTFKPKEDIIRKALEQISGLQVQTVGECDVVLVFCVIVSRTGTDIDAALNELNAHPESKPAVFIVLHHTFDPEKIVPDSSRYVTRLKTLTVDCLFNEDEGLLNCVKNGEALTRIHQWLQPQPEQTWWISTPRNSIMWILSYFGCSNIWRTQVDTEMSKVCSRETHLKVESELILVLLGMSVLEKTAVEHMIFGRQRSWCDASPAPLMKITVDTGVVDGEQVAVINTADWFSSWLSTEEMQQKIQFCIRLSSHGPCAFLLVIPAMQVIEEKTEIMHKFEMIFEESCWEKVIILFTVKDEQQRQYIQVHDLQTNHRNQFHVLNISETEDRSQVSELLKKVKKSVAGSACTLY